ncbi:MAG: rhomboid family intramembrane serine protease [Bacteroidota bacterium]
MDDLVYLMSKAPVAATIFVITLITSFRAFNDSVLRANFMFNPYRIARNKEYNRFLTHGLIHADTMHLAFNMLTYYFFAFYFEQFIGHWQFAVFYLAALILSSATSYVKHKDNPSYNALGASGAVSAVVLGIIMFRPDLELLLFFAIPMPGWLFAILYIGYSQYASRKANDNIGHEAHLWGALAGIVLTLIIRPDVTENIKGFLQTAF